MTLIQDRRYSASVILAGGAPIYAGQTDSRAPEELDLCFQQKVRVTPALAEHHLAQAATKLQPLLFSTNTCLPPKRQLLVSLGARFSNTTVHLARKPLPEHRAGQWGQRANSGAGGEALALGKVSHTNFSMTRPRGGEVKGRQTSFLCHNILRLNAPRMVLGEERQTWGSATLTRT